MTEWMDIKELSLYLNIKVATLFAMKRRGDLPFYKINRLVRFKKSEIDAWLNIKKVGTDSGTKDVQKLRAGTGKMDSMIEVVAKDAIESILKGRREKRAGSRPQERRKSHGKSTKRLAPKRPDLVD